MLQRVHHRLRHLGDVSPELALVAVDEEPDQPRDVVERAPRSEGSWIGYTLKR